ncbi:unnamed protein product, partial [Nesidiocoris tenuis]
MLLISDAYSSKPALAFLPITEVALDVPCRPRGEVLCVIYAPLVVNDHRLTYRHLWYQMEDLFDNSVKERNGRTEKSDKEKSFQVNSTCTCSSLSTTFDWDEIQFALSRPQ